MIEDVLKEALEFIGDVYAGEWHGSILRREQLEEQLRQAIADLEKQEPVAWMYDWTTSEGEFIKDWTTSEAETLRDTEPTIISNVRPLYTHPQQKAEQSPLTDDMAKFIAREFPNGSGDWACKQCHPESEILKDGFVCVVHRAIQAAHGIGDKA